jgi:transposase
MRAYSTDLKERLVRAVADGLPMRAAARRLQVAVTTVKQAVVQQRATGSLARKPIPGRPREIRPEQEAVLLARLAAAPAATIAEHGAWWAEHQGQELSVATRWRALHRLGWTQKNSRWQQAERNEAARRAWREEAAQRSAERHVFVDETGTHIALTRLYGWAPHDQRAMGAVPRTHGKHTTLVAALTPDGLQAPWLIAGALQSETGDWYIRAQLAPQLQPGQVVVLDKLSAHQAASIRAAIEARGCELLYRPPYSPDFTPIEQAFSKIKAHLRRLGARTKEALQEAASLAIETITRDDAAAWFAHAGYALPDQGK